MKVEGVVCFITVIEKKKSFVYIKICSSKTKYQVKWGEKIGCFEHSLVKHAIVVNNLFLPDISFSVVGESARLLHCIGIIPEWEVSVPGSSVFPQFKRQSWLLQRESMFIPAKFGRKWVLAYGTLCILAFFGVWLDKEPKCSKSPLVSFPERFSCCTANSFNLLLLFSQYS